MKIFTHDYYGCTVRVLKTDDGQHWANIDEFTYALECKSINQAANPINQTIN